MNKDLQFSEIPEGYYCVTRTPGERLVIGGIEITVLKFPKYNHVIIGIRSAGPKVDIKRLPPLPGWKDKNR